MWIDMSVDMCVGHVCMHLCRHVCWHVCRYVYIHVYRCKALSDPAVSASQTDKTQAHVHRHVCTHVQTHVRRHVHSHVDATCLYGISQTHFYYSCLLPHVYVNTCRHTCVDISINVFSSYHTYLRGLCLFTGTRDYRNLVAAAEAPAEDHHHHRCTTCLCIDVWLHTPIHMSFYGLMSVHVSVHMSVHMFVHMSRHMSIHMSIHMLKCCLCIRPHAHSRTRLHTYIFRWMVARQICHPCFSPNQTAQWPHTPLPASKRLPPARTHTCTQTCTGMHVCARIQSCSPMSRV